MKIKSVKVEEGLINIEVEGEERDPIYPAMRIISLSISLASSSEFQFHISTGFNKEMIAFKQEAFNTGKLIFQ